MAEVREMKRKHTAEMQAALKAYEETIEALTERFNHFIGETGASSSTDPALAPDAIREDTEELPNASAYLDEDMAPESMGAASVPPGAYIDNDGPPEKVRSVYLDYNAVPADHDTTSDATGAYLDDDRAKTPVEGARSHEFVKDENKSELDRQGSSVGEETSSLWPADSLSGDDELPVKYSKQKQKGRSKIATVETPHPMPCPAVPSSRQVIMSGTIQGNSAPYWQPKVEPSAADQSFGAKSSPSPNAQLLPATPSSCPAPQIRVVALKESARSRVGLHSFSKKELSSEKATALSSSDSAGRWERRDARRSRGGEVNRNRCHQRRLQTFVAAPGTTLRFPIHTPHQTHYPTRCDSAHRTHYITHCEISRHHTTPHTLRTYHHTTHTHTLLVRLPIHESTAVTDADRTKRHTRGCL